MRVPLSKRIAFCLEFIGPQRLPSAGKCRFWDLADIDVDAQDVRFKG
jgi:hypothetical protein